MDNPFFEEWTTPFGVPPFDKIRAEHFEPAFERAISLHDEQIDAIITSKAEPTFANTIEALDAAGVELEVTSNVFMMLCDAESSDELQQIQGRVMPRLALHDDEVMMNDKLFERVRRVYEVRQNLGLDSVQMRLLEKTYKRFLRAGAALSEQNKSALKQINEQLSSLGVKFSNNVLSENNRYRLELSADQLDGLPSAVRDAAAEAANKAELNGKFVFTLHKPSLLPFLTYSTRRELREQLYKAYLNRGNNEDELDNKKIINEIIDLRTQKAHILGYESYADYVISDQMAQKVESVYSLLDEIWTPALALAGKELEAMREEFANDYPNEEFQSWDWWYYAERIRRQNYSLNEEALRQYFSLDNVQQGVFMLANRLYGITFRPIAVPLYNSECSAYEVLDTDNTHLGVLYFDFFPRDGKGQGAWCGNFRDQRYRDGKRVAPVVGIVCNFTRGVGGAPALLSMDETETLFHEFGHALHFLFADVRYHGLLGVEGDFVELPSQIMENWAFEPAMLRMYAAHYRSGEIIPQYMIDKITRSKLFNKGFDKTELLAATYTDLDIHAQKTYQPIDIDAFEYDALHVHRKLLPQIEPRYHYTYFGHIFGGGYAAGYYFYTWAEVLDKDAFSAFKQSGDLFSRRVATDFRRKLLARGGAADGMTLYRDFRGAEPDKTAMLIAEGFMEEPVAAPDEAIAPIMPDEPQTDEPLQLQHSTSPQTR